MEINFRTYNGLAGDLQLLLIAETDCGIREDILFNRTSLFSFYFARKKLIRRVNKQVQKKYAIK